MVKILAFLLWLHYLSVQQAVHNEYHGPLLRVEDDEQHSAYFNLWEKAKEPATAQDPKLDEGFENQQAKNNNTNK